jgi:hypothetical protein
MAIHISEAVTDLWIARRYSLLDTLLEPLGSLLIAVYRRGNRMDVKLCPGVAYIIQVVDAFKVSRPRCPCRRARKFCTAMIQNTVPNILQSRQVLE